MRVPKTCSGLILLLLCFSSNAVAWNRPGHMVTGAIAYYELKSRDPIALSNVINLLKQNPSYAAEWLPQINAIHDNDPDKHGLFLFMYAARWPDDVRDTPLHCEKCHYINYPYKPQGQPASVPTPTPDPQNIQRAFRNFRNTLTNPTTSATNRARALCWIFHMVGDVHQPLHTSALFTTQFPAGDRGGTLFYVAPSTDSETTSLHGLWDGLVMQSANFAAVRNRARGLRSRSDLQRQDFPELHAERRFDWWAKQESFNLAQRDGYRFGQLRGSKDPHNGKVLPANYIATATPVAERRAVLAAYRLADILSEVY
jgi:hypothetical protein